MDLTGTNFVNDVILDGAVNSESWISNPGGQAFSFPRLFVQNGSPTLHITGAAGGHITFVGPATFNAPPAFDVAPDNTLELTDVTDNGYGFTAKGGGTVYLSNPNTTIGGVINLAGGGNLRLEATAGLKLANNVTASGAGNSISGGPLDLGGSRQFSVASGGVLTVSSVVAGSTLTKAGDGTIRLLNNGNTYGTGTLINGGTVFSSGPGAIGPGDVTLGNGALAVGTSVAGFGFNGSGWTFNGSATVANDVVTLTPAQNDQRGSLFFNTAIPTNLAGFQVHFTYKATGPLNNSADGITLILQNDPRGLSALGDAGGALGYAGGAAVTNSAGLALNIYPGNAQNGPKGIAACAGGYINFPYTDVAPVTLDSGNPIDVNLTYDGNTVTAVLAEQGTANTRTLSFFVGSLPSLITGNAAYLGFTGSTGGVNARQDVSNFSFTANNINYANNVIVNAGANASIQVLAAIGNPSVTTSVTMGTLSMGAGATLSVGPYTGSAANANYSLTLGPTALAGDAVFNVSNNGTGSGTLILGQTSGGRDLGKGGDGTLVLTAAPTHNRHTNVAAGTLSYDIPSGSPVVGATAMVTISNDAVVDAGGSVDPFTDGTTTTRHAAIVNNSTAVAGFVVSSGSKQVASVSGTGSTAVATNATLPARYLRQDTLTIGPNGRVVIDMTAPIVVNGTWIASTGSPQSWGAPENWDGGLVPGENLGDRATFANSIGSTDMIVHLDGDRTLSALNINHGGANYTIAQGAGGILTLDNLAAPATVTVAGGSGRNHAISAPLALNSDVSISTAASTTLTVSGPITEAVPERSLTKDGAGTLVITAAPAYRGNTNVIAGTLIYNITGGSPAVGAHATVTISGSAVLRADGNVDPFTDGTTATQHALIVNNSSAPAGLDIVLGSKQVTGISGDAGKTTVEAGATLTAQYIFQDTLTLGGPNAKVIIDATGGASDIPFSVGSAISPGMPPAGADAPADGTLNQVPEPGTLLLLAAALCVLPLLWRRQRIAS